MINIEKHFANCFMYGISIDCENTIETYFKKYISYAIKFGEDNKLPKDWVKVNTEYSKWRMKNYKEKLKK